MNLKSIDSWFLILSKNFSYAETNQIVPIGAISATLLTNLTFENGSLIISKSRVKLDFCSNYKVGLLFI